LKSLSAIIALKIIQYAVNIWKLVHVTHAIYVVGDVLAISNTLDHGMCDVLAISNTLDHGMCDVLAISNTLEYVMCDVLNMSHMLDDYFMCDVLKNVKKCIS
jgi:hypothetical protein